MVNEKISRNNFILKFEEIYHNQSTNFKIVITK